MTNRLWQGVEAASMGPRSFNRGKQRLDPAGGRGPDASMGPRSFNRGKRRQGYRGVPDYGSFNGASVFQPRKGHDHFGDVENLHALQWGLGLSTEESTWRDWIGNMRLRLQWGLGLSTEESGPPDKGRQLSEEASMGPRSFNRGKIGFGHRPGGFRDASMGPRSFNRGKAGAAMREPPDPTASMGPRSFNRGKSERAGQ